MTIPRELKLAEYMGEIVLTQQPISKPNYEIDQVIPKTGTVGLTGFANVGYNADKGVIFVNGFEAPYEPVGEKLNLKVIVDNSSIELFTGDGVRSISLSLFPTAGIPRDLAPLNLG